VQSNDGNPAPELASPEKAKPAAHPMMSENLEIVSVHFIGHLFIW
jgi:hypothetical protein